MMQSHFTKLKYHGFDQWYHFVADTDAEMGITSFRKLCIEQIIRAAVDDDGTNVSERR